MLNNQIIGPIFYEGNMNAEIYENVLLNLIVPRIIKTIFFQQDGASYHYGRNVRRYLDTVFPDRWIGRRGCIEWPARSPDMTPLDYFLWGYHNDRVYKTNPRSLKELRQRIQDECDNMPAEYLANAIERFYNRLGYCQEVDESQFENLLK